MCFFSCCLLSSSPSLCSSFLFLKTPSLVNAPQTCSHAGTPGTLYYFSSCPPNINVKAFGLSFPLDLLLFALYSVCNGIMLYAHCPYVGPENPDVCMYPWAVGMNNSSRCSTVPVGRFHTFYLFLTDYSVLYSLRFPPFSSQCLHFSVYYCECSFSSVNFIRDAVPVTQFLFAACDI